MATCLVLGFAYRALQQGFFCYQGDLHEVIPQLGADGFSNWDRWLATWQDCAAFGDENKV